MARDRLMSLRQVQRIQASGPIGFEYNEDQTSLAPSLSLDSVLLDINDKSPDDQLKIFLAKVVEVRGPLSELREDVENVRLKQSEILSSPNTNDPVLRKELDSLTSRIKIVTKIIRSNLKGIESEITREEESGQWNHGAQHRIKKTQHSTLLNLFMESINEYLATQADYQDRCKEKMKRQLEIVGTTLEDEEVEKLMDDQEGWNVFTQGIISEPAVTKQMLADIESRHTDILQLEKSIRELHDVFVEMFILVERQGESINRIENHVAAAKDYVGQSNKKLKAALEFQKDGRKKKVIIITILISVLIVVLIPIIVVLL